MDIEQAASAYGKITVEKYIAFLRTAAKYFDFYLISTRILNLTVLRKTTPISLKSKKAGFPWCRLFMTLKGKEIQTYINRGYRRVALRSKQMKTLSNPQKSHAKV